MKQTTRGTSRLETSTGASGKNVNWCCNFPANFSARADSRAAARPNNLRNLARMRGLGFDCGERVAADERRFQAVGKKQSAWNARINSPLWCRFSGEWHEDRAKKSAHENSAPVV